MDHSDKPQQADTPRPESRDAMRRILSSDYYSYLQPLAAAVTGKAVADSQAGTSGFLLFLNDGSWVASYLAEGYLRYEIGQDQPPQDVLGHLDSPAFGDARRPLSVSLPYGNEPCDITAQVARSHGLPITGLAFGEKCFNFRFPGGWELDTMIVLDASGKTALRVFFEQW